MILYFMGGYYGYYFWMIDDVFVFETPPYVMDIEDIVSIDQSVKCSIFYYPN